MHSGLQPAGLFFDVICLAGQQDFFFKRFGVVFVIDGAVEAVVFIFKKMTFLPAAWRKR